MKLSIRQRRVASRALIFLGLVAAFSAVAIGGGGTAGLGADASREPVSLRYCVDPDWPPYEVISKAAGRDRVET